jgi:hypothetical protein
MSSIELSSGEILTDATFACNATETHQRYAKEKLKWSQSLKSTLIAIPEKMKWSRDHVLTWGYINCIFSVSGN